MQTVTVSLRLPESEVSRLESGAQAMGIDRSTLLRWAIRRGASALPLERACDAYRRGEVTLSRAAEIAGLSLRDLILRLRDQDLVLNYAPEDLAADLQPLLTVVADASPLIFLGKIRRLAMIDRVLGGDVVVPQQVRDEVLALPLDPAESDELHRFLAMVRSQPPSERAPQ